MLPFVRRAILTGKLSHNDKIKRHDEYTDVFPPRALPLAFFLPTNTVTDEPLAFPFLYTCLIRRTFCEKNWQTSKSLFVSFAFLNLDSSAKTGHIMCYSTPTSCRLFYFWALDSKSVFHSVDVLELCDEGFVANSLRMYCVLDLLLIV